MNHILARLKDAPYEAVRRQLQQDADQHAAQGLYLEHVWKNTEDAQEVFFLFRAEDLPRAKRLIADSHAEARRHDPATNLPQMIYLES